jgi:hypothetical protein
MLILRLVHISDPGSHMMEIFRTLERLKRSTKRTFVYLMDFNTMYHRHHMRLGRSLVARKGRYASLHISVTCKDEANDCIEWFPARV